VSHRRGADEWLEPDEGRLSCPVLRGRRRSNALLLPDQVHGIDERGKAVLRKQLRRAQVAVFFGNLPPCVIGMEACAGAHFRARKLTALGRIRRFAVAQYSRVRSSDAATKWRFPARQIDQHADLCQRDFAPRDAALATSGLIGI
jgi:hypothetical protein